MNENKSFSLNKGEIIRGYRSFESIFNKSKLFKTNLLSGYLKTNILSLENSPLRINKVRVGFVLPKKNFRKSSERNKIRRLLKEAYRLNRNYYMAGFENINIQLLIGFNQDSEYLSSVKKRLINYKLINEEVTEMLEGISRYLNSRGETGK